MMFYCVFLIFPCCILGQVWYLIVSISDLCLLTYRPVHLAKNDPSPKTNSLRNVIKSFSIRKVSCFIEKSPQKIRGEMVFFLGGGDTENDEKSLKTGN